MHLPSHAALNLTVLSAWTTPEQRPFVLAGALLPDIPVIIFYLVCRFVFGLTDSQIWKDYYYREPWFSLFATTHSLPLTGGLALFGMVMGYHAVALVGASMLLHALVDLPLHAKDAHRHFYPFTNYRFRSPISYWNPRYWGRFVAAGEVLLLVTCSVFLLGALETWWAKTVVVIAILVYLVVYAALYLGPYGKNYFESMTLEPVDVRDVTRR